VSQGESPEFKPQYCQKKEKEENYLRARCQWLMPVILTTCKSEISRIKAPDLPGQKVLETQSQQKKLGIVACACHPSYCEKHLKKS
jgi:hypothetical protein